MSDDASKLISDLEKRLLQDMGRLNAWWRVHRTLGIISTMLLVGIPPVVAAGFLSAEDWRGKAALLVVTVIAAFTSVFQPLMHSELRRQDVNRTRRLYDELRADDASCGTDNVKRLQIFKKYAEKYADVFSARGKRLLDASLAARHATHDKNNT